MNINFIDSFVTWQQDELEVDLVILVDNINFEDVYGVNIDGTQFHNVEDIIEESDLNPPLHFK